MKKIIAILATSLLLLTTGVIVGDNKSNNNPISSTIASNTSNPITKNISEIEKANLHWPIDPQGINCSIKTKDGQLFIGTGSGLWVTINNGLYLTHLSTANGISGDMTVVNQLLLDSKGDIWFAAYGPVDSSSNTFSEIFVSKDDGRTFNRVYPWSDPSLKTTCTDFQIAPDGKIWALAANLVLNPDHSINPDRVWCSSDNGLTWLPATLTSASTSINSSYITSLAFDSNGYTYILHPGGILRAPKNSLAFVDYIPYNPSKWDSEYLSMFIANNKMFLSYMYDGKGTLNFYVIDLTKPSPIFTTMLFNGQQYTSHEIRGVYTDSFGDYWLGFDYDSTIYFSNAASGLKAGIEFYSLPDSQDSDINFSFSFNLNVDFSNTMWISTGVSSLWYINVYPDHKPKNGPNELLIGLIIVSVLLGFALIYIIFKQLSPKNEAIKINQENSTSEAPTHKHKFFKSEKTPKVKTPKVKMDKKNNFDHLFE